MGTMGFTVTKEIPNISLQVWEFELQIMFYV